MTAQTLLPPQARLVRLLLPRILDTYETVAQVEVVTRLDGRFMVVLFGQYIPRGSLAGGRVIMTVSASRVRLLVRHYVDDVYDDATLVMADCPDPKPELLEVCRVHQFIDVLIFNQKTDLFEFQNLLAWIQPE